MTALLFLWRNRTAALGVLQIILSQIAVSGLTSDHATKWLMLGTGIATGLVGLMNTIAAKRAQAAQEPTE
jgi:hypothetical protein